MEFVIIKKFSLYFVFCFPTIYLANAKTTFSFLQSILTSQNTLGRGSVGTHSSITLETSQWGYEKLRTITSWSKPYQ